jgi:hypothetical protein
MAIDFLIDNQGDLAIQGGDFVVGQSDLQHVKHLLIAEKGNYKNAPLTGVGIRRYQFAAFSPLITTKLRADISVQLKADGFKASVLKVRQNGKIEVDGNY